MVAKELLTSCIIRVLSLLLFLIWEFVNNSVLFSPKFISLALYNPMKKREIFDTHNKDELR